jgi:hypothetical protein
MGTTEYLVRADGFEFWSLQISQKPRFILRFLAMFSLGFGFFAMYDQNLTRIRIKKRLCLGP